MYVSISDDRENSTQNTHLHDYQEEEKKKNLQISICNLLLDEKDAIVASTMSHSRIIKPLSGTLSEGIR